MTQQVFGSYKEAAATLPAGAKWSASFGNPGQGGYSEYFRTAEGKRFAIENGSWSAFEPFVWTVKEVA